MIKLNPYLVFKDNCEEAFLFYKKIFSGEILFMGRYKDAPQTTRQFFPGSTDDQVMHATLKINDETILMGNDSVETYEKSKDTFTNNFFLYISTENEADAYRIFDDLSIGGKITLPIAQTFWSTTFGIVTDKFGISWKVTFDPVDKPNSNKADAL
ncbi:VOC family protein [Mucilaginibacter paludis]|uniref:Glyoxalase/bleomycin resistance protein/dioxygenase n=1 Tax=Mucilaginibacter paludis DSM 18603 TaxID=714943 RepID=H1Y0N4_9SPHI|nr:VOC family protein [Mucilaginibacter paludis]EHQ28774.1 Glyoxalase/bleomycin resistance protein/dioxygenase [Mucilaginibacter paludis DSM 18603]